MLRDLPFAPGDTPAAGGVPVEQVIVTSEPLAKAFRALVDRETSRGVPTVLRTTKWIDANYAGADAPARIRAFLSDAHERWGTRWVVLGGDVEHVPVRYVPWFDTEIPTDLYYECLDREWNEDGDAIFAEPLTAANLVDFVNDVAQGADGRVWVAMNVGVAVFADGRFDLYTTRQGLPSDTVHDVDVSADGAVWVGTSLGAARLEPGGGWSTHDRSSGLPGNDVLRVLALGAGDVWAGTSEGLAHWNGEAWTTFTVADGLPTNTVTALAHDGRRLWIGSLRGAVSFQDGVFTVYDAATGGILSDHVLSITVDPSGDVWFGHLGSYFHSGGLSRFDGSRWFTDGLVGWGGPSVRALAFGPGAGELWAATPAGLLHRAGGRDEMLGEAEGLAGTDVQSVARGAGGTLVVGGSEGLTIGSRGAWTVLTTEDGLPAPPLAYDDVDLVPDIVSGRIPATDASEAAAYLQKLFAYQDGIATDHAERALLLGEVVFAGSDGKDICVQASQRLPANFAATGLYEVDGTQDVATTLAELTRGHGIVLHVGHGSYDVLAVGPSSPDRGLLFNSQIDRISAGGRAGLVIGYNCNSGGFDQDCAMEHLLFNRQGGAVVTTANTRTSMLHLDAAANDLFLQELFASEDGKPALALRAARTRLLEQYSAEMRLRSWWRHHYLAHSFLGAPTISLWRRAPRELTVSHPAVLSAGRAEVPVVVRDAEDGSPISGALVCLSKGGEDYAYGRTGDDGTVRFDFRPETPGPLRVVATAPDFRPYDGAATVTAAVEPNLVAASWRRIDAPGQAAWRVQFALRNAGPASAGFTTLALTCEDPRVAVVAGAGALTAVGTGDTAWTSLFELAPAEPLSDGEVFSVRLDGSGGAVFSETFRLVASSARLEFDGLAIEGAELRPRVANRGGSPSGTLTATLRALDEHGTVIRGAATAAAIGPGETAMLSGLRVAGEAGARFELVIDDGAGRVLRRNVERERPSGVASARAEPAEGGALVCWTPSDSPDLAGYRVLGRANGGPWTDQFGSLVTAGSRARVGLAPGVSRDLLVLAVDSSGNASADSCFVTAHAPRPVLRGWPRRLSSVVGPSSIVAVDLDADGSREILHGSLWDANAAHVFRADGTEWTDGDGNAATVGVFGKTGGRVVSTPLAIDVDGDGAREVFAGSYDGLLHAWRTGGPQGGSPAVLPGFPAVLSGSALRSSPVAGDLDGDGAPEIVVVSSYREVHAFEPDGTRVPGWPRVVGSGGLHTTPAVHDLDLDGREDVVFGGGDDRVIYAVSGDGSDLPGWPVDTGAAVRSSPVLVDVDGDSRPEVFALAVNGTVHGLDAMGRPLRGWPVATAALSPKSNASPAVADLDRDGRPEIVVAADGAIAVLRGDGSHLPGAPISIDAPAAGSPVVADVDADGEYEILLGTEDRRMHAFELDGSDASGWPFPLGEVARAEPYVADVDGDGRLDVAIGGDDAWLRVLRLETPAVPGAAPWPGFHGGADLDGVYQHAPYELRPDPLAGSPATPLALRLEGAWPNPFRERTQVRLILAQAGPVQLDVLDVQGRRVATLLDGAVLPAGPNTVSWGGRDIHHAPVASGVYFVRLRTGDEVRTRKLLRLR
jgi:hypothetical protein